MNREILRVGYGGIVLDILMSNLLTGSGNREIFLVGRGRNYIMVLYCSHVRFCSILIYK